MFYGAETKVGTNKTGDRKNAAWTEQDGRRAVNCQKTGMWSYLHVWIDWKGEICLESRAFCHSYVPNAQD